MFADATVVKEGGQLIVHHGNDKECWVEFRKHPVHQEVESEAQHRPIYRDVDYITIQFPGDKTKKVDRPVNNDDKLRFPQHWQQFEATGLVTQIGLPLEEWPQLTRSQAMEMKGIGVHTVEQLSNIGDHLLTFLGAREYRDKAREFLAKAESWETKMAELEERLAKRENGLRDRIDALMAENDALKVRANAQEARQDRAEGVAAAPEAKKKPGRPRKVAQETTLVL